MIFSEENTYTTRRYLVFLRDVDYYLHHTSYVLAADASNILNEQVL